MIAADAPKYQIPSITTTVPRVVDSARTESSTTRRDPATNPLIILDVDGVLSPLRALDSGATWGDWDTCPGAQVRVPVSPSMGRALASLPGEIVLCSDWGSRASVVSEALGWGEVPALRRELPSRWWWKLDAVRAFLGARPRRPIAWVDDELRNHPEAAAWMMRAGVPALLLSPDPREGVTPDDVERLAAFCRDCTSSLALEISGPMGDDIDMSFPEEEY